MAKQKLNTDIDQDTEDEIIEFMVEQYWDVIEPNLKESDQQPQQEPEK